MGTTTSPRARWSSRAFESSINLAYRDRHFGSSRSAERSGPMPFLALPGNAGEVRELVDPHGQKVGGAARAMEEPPVSLGKPRLSQELHSRKDPGEERSELLDR